MSQEGPAPIERDLPSGEHEYDIWVDEKINYAGHFTVIAGKTVRLTPTLSITLSKAMSDYREGRLATARRFAEEAVELAGKFGDVAKRSKAYGIEGATDCRMNDKEAAIRARSHVNTETDREFIESACKDAGIELK